MALMQKFEMMRQAQWEKGASEYGDVAFLDLPIGELFTMLQEELADVANYAMMLHVRVQVLEMYIAGSTDPAVQPSAGDPQYPVSPGAGSFVASSRLSGFLPDRERVQDPGQRSGGEQDGLEP